MFLRSLTIKGFKSFADTTTLELEPGVTVVVGPNGSGKSNIVDAVAWVLGAQGPRTVRSSKMDDVIFAGSSRRPALGRAEVSLTIDNSSRVLPIDFTEVTITRTLFRSSGESEYSLNGVACRLLDVQELLSDTGVGRQQHVIVSQGNLDSVLEARPEDRRLIIEEAAGILKFRRRKEKAQRRLEGTEGNLVRLTDLLREVRRQMRPLERQAEAARRHGALVEELRALRLYLTGRELAALDARVKHASSERTRLLAGEATLRTELVELDGAVAEAEAALSHLQGPRLGELVGRLEALRERGRGLGALLGERHRSLEHRLSSATEQSLVSALESEAAELAGELAELDQSSAGLPPRFAELAQAETELAEAREQIGDLVVTTGRIGEVRGELTALRIGVDRGRAEITRLENRLAEVDQERAQLSERISTEQAAVDDLTRSDEALSDSLREAEAERAVAAGALADAESQVRKAESDHQVWRARAEALAMAIEESRASGGSVDVAEVRGVLGRLLELVEVDSGWEAAFEAAAGDSLAAVVVDGMAAARDVLGLLAGSSTAATVIPPAGVQPGVAAEPPPGFPGEPLRSHVRSRLANVDGWLDVALGGVVVVDGAWDDALDMALAHPDLVVVTRQGDRFGPAGWRIGTGRGAATQAALEEAESRAGSATEVLTVAETNLDAARQRTDAAGDLCRQASEALDDVRARIAAASSTLQRIDAERAHLASEGNTLRAHIDQLAERVDHEVARMAELDGLMPQLMEKEASEARELEARRAAQSLIEERAAAVNSLRTELEVRAAGLQERRAFLVRRQTEVHGRLERVGIERQGASARREEIERLAARTGWLAAAIRTWLEGVDEAHGDVSSRRQRQAQASESTSARLKGLRMRRQAAERELEEVRERARRAELDEAEARMRLEAVVESVRRDLDCEPETAVEASCPDLPDGTSAPSRVRELERELRLMGPINPLALEELTALEERHRFLSEQLDDVRNTRRELTKVIRAVDAEIVQLLAAAYADVADNFTRLFETLFPGGHGRLRLTDPDNLLESGIEIEARPFGKNVRKLSLLSGGERSLCALAFLFAVFRSRPSPFYLLDEVEAALDDVNLHRFLDLLDEFRQEAQLLVVSHQKRTMEAADSLYGVTMQPGGSSKVVSEKLRTPA